MVETKTQIKNNKKGLKMEKHHLQIALETISAETEDFTVRSYSGRNMYGKKCLAISGNDINLLALGAELKRELSDNLSREILFGALSDELGLGQVYYWPNIPYFEEEIHSNRIVR